MVNKVEFSTWKDGSNRVCSVCGKPILKGEPIYRTNSETPKKRDAYHAVDCTKSNTISANDLDGMDDLLWPFGAPK